MPNSKKLDVETLHSEIKRGVLLLLDYLEWSYLYRHARDTPAENKYFINSLERIGLKIAQIEDYYRLDDSARFAFTKGYEKLREQVPKLPLVLDGKYGSFHDFAAQSIRNAVSECKDSHSFEAHYFARRLHAVLPFVTTPFDPEYEEEIEQFEFAANAKTSLISLIEKEYLAVLSQDKDSEAASKKSSKLPAKTTGKRKPGRQVSPQRIENDRLVFERFEKDPGYPINQDGTKSSTPTYKATCEMWLDKYDDMDFLTENISEKDKANCDEIAKEIQKAIKRHKTRIKK